MEDDLTTDLSMIKSLSGSLPKLDITPPVTMPFVIIPPAIAPPVCIAPFCSGRPPGCFRSTAAFDSSDFRFFDFELVSVTGNESRCSSGSRYVAITDARQRNLQSQLTPTHIFPLSFSQNVHLLQRWHCTAAGDAIDTCDRLFRRI